MASAAQEIAERFPFSSNGEIEFLADELRRGVSKLYEFSDASFIARPEGKELVIVCFEGKNLRTHAATIAQAARESGFKALRFHTRRGGLVRLVRFLNPEIVEYVLHVRL